MARILSQTLIRQSQTLVNYPPPSSRSPLFPASRFISSKRPGKVQLLELDLGPESESESEPESGSGSGSQVEMLGIRRLQEAIRAIVIRRAAPDWIPFVPGSSYWVPPAAKTIPMTEEEELAFSSPRGWPSFSYFVEGVLPQKVDICPEKTNHSPEKAIPESENEESGLQCADKISQALPQKVENIPEKASPGPEKTNPKSDDEESGLNSAEEISGPVLL